MQSGHARERSDQQDERGRLNERGSPLTAALSDESKALDRIAHAAFARWNGGISPASLSIAYAEWGFGLATSPGTLWYLHARAWEHAHEWIATQGNLLIEDREAASEIIALRLEGDDRFLDSAWHRQPWRAFATLTKTMERWVNEATELRGISDRSREKVRFYNRQWLDFMSPSNWPLSNPEVISKCVESAGGSIVDGAKLLANDLRKQIALDDDEDDADALRPGCALAITPGKVVMRNRLVELIRYAPTTSIVFAEPVLIVPSCIMKYYILDLSERNSMVRWLVSQGHTVFILSWRNPDKSDASLDMDDYVEQGVLEALSFVSVQCRQPVHLAGYCFGGTFAAIAAAYLQQRQSVARDAGELIASLTLLAAETDFSEPGELGVLIDESQVQAIEAMMSERGFLTGRQMAATFQFLHARDLVWSTRTRSYLLGESAFVNDLVSWNADVTRLPATMHGQYLRKLYLHNELANGKYRFRGDPISLRDIQLPLFVVGTEKDHVSPWKSVFKIHQLVSGDVTFVLTKGGHNAGILSEPGHAGRHFRVHCTEARQARLSPPDWLDAATLNQGSWWECWSTWIQEGQATRRARPLTGGLCDAPGTYVMVRYDD